jgi:hypothetical protein
VHHEEYVRDQIRTNTVEGYYSIFKRGMKGVYQHCSEKHLHRYLAEYDFRYNHRVALGYSDDARTAEVLKGIPRQTTDLSAVTSTAASQKRSPKSKGYNPLIPNEESPI